MATPPCQHRARAALLASSHASRASQAPHAQLAHGDELDDSFSGLDGGSGIMTVAGFGSLLSERSARTTFPDLQNFRPGRLYGFRRVFAHTADIFFERGIANPATREIGSLSCEPISSSSSSSDSSAAGASSSHSSSVGSNDGSSHHGGTGGGSAAGSASSGSAPHSGPSLVVSLFEVPFMPASIAAFIAREHEFRFLAVQPYDLGGTQPAPRLAVLCAANTDEHYRATRCPPDEWARRWGVHGIASVWSDDVLPCRVYLRHCVLAAKGLCAEAYDSFLDATFLADRATTIRQYLRQHPEIMDELPPPALVGRYSG